MQEICKEVTMELLFHNSEFELEVRERLNIFDRALTDADAKLMLLFVFLGSFSLSLCFVTQRIPQRFDKYRGKLWIDIKRGNQTVTA